MEAAARLHCNAHRHAPIPDSLHTRVTIQGEDRAVFLFFKPLDDRQLLGSAGALPSQGARWPLGQYFFHSLIVWRVRNLPWRPHVLLPCLVRKDVQRGNDSGQNCARSLLAHRGLYKEALWVNF